MNACVVLFTNDLVMPLGLGKRNPIFTARFSTVIVGTLGLLLSLYESDLLALLLLTGSFYMPIVGVPLGLAIFGFRSSKRAVLISMAAGFTTVFLWRSFFAYTGIDSVMPATLVSLIVLLGTHYLLGEPGGWQKVAPDSPLALERAARKAAWKRHVATLKAFRLYPYLQQNLPQQASFYPLFGLYILAATYAPLYTLAPALREQYDLFYKFIYHSVLGLSTTLITYPIWHPRLQSKQLLTWLWPAASFYALFYVASMLVVISGFHQVQLMGFMLNFVVAMLSLHWVLALIMALGGSILALYTFQWTMGVAALPAEWSLVSFTILYFYFILLLFVSVFMATRHRNAATQLAVRNTRLTAKQQTLWQQLMQALYRREHFVQEMTTEGAQALRMVNKLSHTLARQVEQASNMPPSLTKAQKTLQQASQKLTVVGNYLHEMIARLQDYLPLEVSTFHIETLLEAMEQGLAEQGLSPPPQVIYQVHTQHKELQGDVNKLKELLVRSICYIYEHHHANYILLSIQDTTLGYRLRTIPEYVKRVEALCWTITLENDVPPCKAFYMGNKEQPVTSIVQGSSLLSLKPNQQIVDAHYGASELLTGEQGLTQVYVIPVHVRAVRPQAMESLSTAPPLPEAYVYPAEQAFIEAVTNKTKGAEALLEKALGLLKQYHDGVYCKSGVPFYLYPIAVAHLLLAYSQDEDTVLAALLHETVETTRLSLNQIGILFNPTVQQLVAGITRLDSNLKSFKRLQLSEDEALMQLIEVKDERILYVKLAARLHAMRALGEHSSSSHRKQLASETLQFYVLLAERLGLQEVAQEFKELCLQVFRQKD